MARRTGGIPGWRTRRPAWHGVRLLVFAMLLGGPLAAIVATAPSGAQQGPRATRVAVELVERRTVREAVPVIGELVARTRSVIAARVPGIVQSVPVDVGDRVTAGDPLARLDTSELLIELGSAQATLEQAQASLEVAQANRTLAEQSYERVRDLRGSAAFSRGRFDDLAQQLAASRGAVAEAEASLARSTAALAQAKEDLADAVTKAPFDGVILERHAQPGAYVATGSPIVTLLDVGAIEVEANVPTERIAGLGDAAEVALMLDDGSRHTATVRAIVPQETATTRTRPVRFTPNFGDRSKPLATGESVSLEIPSGPEREALIVPKDALVQRQGGWLVYAVVDGKAAAKPVEIGAAIGGGFEVRSGLAAGDLVVVRGNERLRPGQPLAYDMPAGAADTTPEPDGDGSQAEPVPPPGNESAAKRGEGTG